MINSAAAEPPVTGHPAIDEALARLDLGGPVAEHADELQRVHQVLQDVLNPSPSGPPRSGPAQSGPVQSGPPRSGSPQSGR